MTATYTYHGFLFGHYDSRGGTTFVEADSRDAALLRYVIGFGYEDGKPTQFDVPTAEWLRMIEDEDFLCEAIIKSDEELIVGMDLDGEFTGDYDPDTAARRTAWVPKPADGVHTTVLVMGCIALGVPVVIRYGAKPGDDWIAPGSMTTLTVCCLTLYCHQRFDAGGAPGAAGEFGVGRCRRVARTDFAGAPAPWPRERPRSLQPSASPGPEDRRTGVKLVALGTRPPKPRPAWAPHSMIWGVSLRFVCLLLAHPRIEKSGPDHVLGLFESVAYLDRKERCRRFAA